MKTMRWTRAVAVMLFAGVLFLSAAGFGEAASTAPAGTKAVALAEGQRLALKDGGFLTLKNGQLTLVNRAGAAKVFPGGSKLAQDSRGQVSIWGTGGTTIVGIRSFDDQALPRVTQPKPIVTPNSAVLQSPGPATLTAKPLSGAAPHQAAARQGQTIAPVKAGTISSTSIRPVVASSNPRTLKLTVGADPTTVTLQGSNLNLISGVQVISGENRPAATFFLKLANSVSSATRTLSLAARENTQVGLYTLWLLAGQTAVAVPLQITVLAPEPAAPSGGNSAAGQDDQGTENLVPGLRADIDAALREALHGGGSAQADRQRDSDIHKAGNVTAAEARAGRAAMLANAGTLMTPTPPKNGTLTTAPASTPMLQQPAQQVRGPLQIRIYQHTCPPGYTLQSGGTQTMLTSPEPVLCIK